jgi:hypothetical protein
MDPLLAGSLLVLGNILAHEAPPPPYAPAVVRELLSRPREVLDAENLFLNAVPPELHGGVVPREMQSFENLLDQYVDELSSIQRSFQEAVRPFDDAALLRRLADGLPSADQLLRAGNAVDAAMLRAVTGRFLESTLRFAHAARRAGGFPPQGLRLDSPIGLVVVGTAGNDRHGPEAALIVDPGGDDLYERRPAIGGAVSVIVDLGGNDTYTGSDVAVRGLSALVDFAGEDRYAMTGAGLGAAIAGVSLLLDAEGNDSYEAHFFAQGAGAAGFGALVDVEGNDRYRVRAWGQGFGAAGGTGLLWDRGGDDAYAASGEADPFERGGRLSGAQGAAFGFRTLLGGGIGILRDSSGNDSYEAELFAQGVGYYYGTGLLWDERGDDFYRAVRYAQGHAAHEAVGLLRDESGNDGYRLSFGVGQGMGLDLALGVLFDGGGNDDYRAGRLAQGTATANGIGMLLDGGGADRWQVELGPRNWGHAEAWRRLPSVGLLAQRSNPASFVLAGDEREAPPAIPPAEESTAPGPCAKPAPADLREIIAGLRREHFDAVAAAGEALRCSGDRALMEEVLRNDPASPLGAWIAPFASEKPLYDLLSKHPSCTARAIALEARGDRAAARAARGSTCLRLQAAARAVLAAP